MHDYISEVCVCTEGRAYLRELCGPCSVSITGGCSPLVIQAPTDRPYDHRHQLGLHDVANYYWLPERERVVKQRMFIALRIFDAYITSSLGLPRTLRVTDTSGTVPTDAKFIDNRELLTASNANVELLDIMSNARESIFSTDTTTPGRGPRIIRTALLCEISDSLDRWAPRFHVFAQITADASIASIK